MSFNWSLLDALEGDCKSLKPGRKLLNTFGFVFFGFFYETVNCKNSGTTYNTDFTY